MKWLLFYSVFSGIVSGAYCQHTATQPVPVNITVDVAKPAGQKIRNVFSDLNFWDFRFEWMDKAADKPAGFFKEHYPFVQHVQIMTATGGSPERDLFVDPANRAVLTDYNFKPLVAAIHNVLRQGLKPMIKTGSVPSKFAAQPKIGFFGVNVRPPADYNAYHDYIKALADTVVKVFGRQEVNTWSWGVLTEYENKDWFAAEGDDPEATKIAYFKLYDYTVAALQSVIGAKNLKVGAHSMSAIPGLWDELEFIDHVAKGTNYKTGKKGTQINFLCASFYELSPGVLVDKGFTLAGVLNHLRNRAEQNGLHELEYGIDEGRILNGPPDDKRDLTSRVVGFSYQGASDARMFKTMSDINAHWFSGWSLTTKGIWEGLLPVGTHVAALGYKMVGNQRLGVAVSGTPADTANKVDAMASYDKKSGTVRVLLYNFNNNMHSASAENTVVTLRNVSAAAGKTVQVKQWTVDDTHGNFWPTWWKDMNAQGITNDDFVWSKYSIDLPSNMRTQSAKDFWNSKEPGYYQLTKLEPVTQTIAVKNNTLVLPVTLAHHGVTFYEITNVK